MDTAFYSGFRKFLPQGHGIEYICITLEVSLPLNFEIGQLFQIDTIHRTYF